MLYLLRRDLFSLDPLTWETLLDDSTSLVPRTTILEERVLEVGLGPVGVVPIPRELWDAVVPPSFVVVTQEPSFRTKHLSDHTKRMLHTIARDNSSVFCENESGWGANCWVFVVPKNALKTTLTFHSVGLNEKYGTKPPHFTLPALDILFLLKALIGEWGLH